MVRKVHAAVAKKTDTAPGAFTHVSEGSRFQRRFDSDGDSFLWARFSLAHADKLPFSPGVYQAENKQEPRKTHKKQDNHCNNYQQRLEEHGGNYSSQQ